MAVVDAKASSKLLVVEDDPDTREILVEFFSSHGYQVTAVTSAEDGLAELKENTTDVVVSDNQLDGGRTGSWMVRRAYADGLLRRVAVVMYSADDNLEVPRSVRVLHKPSSLVEIERTADLAIDSARRRERELDGAPPTSKRER